MRWLCLRCGRPFETAGNEMGGKCPICGSDQVAPSQAPQVGGDAPMASGIPAIGDRAEHLEAAASSVALVCVNGHTFAWRVVPTDYGACPHGTETVVLDKHKVERPVQVELHCSCGAKLSVVGHEGSRACPRCGNQMICPKCAAAATPENEQVVCPICGGPPASVVDAPAVKFRGAVTKTIAGSKKTRRH